MILSKDDLVKFCVLTMSCFLPSWLAKKYFLIVFLQT